MTILRQRQPRERDDKYLAFVRTLPCCVCNAPAPSEACHIRMSNLDIGKEYTGKGEKPHDRFALPMCSPVIGETWGCHGRQHRGSEVAFWKVVGKDPFAIAARLYALGGGTITTRKPRARSRFVGSRKIQQGKTVWAKRELKSRNDLRRRPMEAAQ